MENKALIYAEKYGIIDYRVEGKYMYWSESFPNEGNFYHVLNLETMDEKVTELTLVKGRTLSVDQRVKVYFNLHKKCFSIQDKNTGLVVAHAPSVKMKNVEFKVSEKGRQRVLREKKKNVHAFVVGLFQIDVEKACNEPVFYNPYTTCMFTSKWDNSYILKCEYACLADKQITIA